MSVLNKLAFVLSVCPVLINSEPQVPPTQQQYGAQAPASLPPIPSPSYGPPGHTPGKPIGPGGGTSLGGVAGGGRSPGNPGPAKPQGGLGAGGNNPGNARGGMRVNPGAVGGNGAAFGNQGGARGNPGASSGASTGFGNAGGAQRVSAAFPAIHSNQGSPGFGSPGGAQAFPGTGIGFPGGVRGSTYPGQMPSSNYGGSQQGFGGNSGQFPQGAAQGNAGASLGGTVSGIVADLGSMAAGALGSVSDGIRSIEGSLGSGSGGIPGNIRDVLQNAGGAIGSVPGNIRGVLQNAGGALSNVAGGLGSSATNYGDDSSSQCRNKDPNANKQLVMNFYQEIFGDKNEDALEKYVAPDMINHNPMSTNGIEGLRQMLAGPFGQGPPVKIQFMRVAADGDLVWTHVKLPVPAIGMTFAAVDIFRINCQGLIQEHWDVFQGINVQSMNPRPFF